MVEVKGKQFTGIIYAQLQKSSPKLFFRKKGSCRITLKSQIKSACAIILIYIIHILKRYTYAGINLN